MFFKWRYSDCLFDVFTLYTENHTVKCLKCMSSNWEFLIVLGTREREGQCEVNAKAHSFYYLVMLFGEFFKKHMY